MELTKKTTILLTPRLYRQLRELSVSRKQSIGELIRAACEKQYGLVSERSAHSAVEKLNAISLPVDTPAIMKRESVPAADDIVP